MERVLLCISFFIGGYGLCAGDNNKCIIAKLLPTTLRDFCFKYPSDTHCIDLLNAISADGVIADKLKSSIAGISEKKELSPQTTSDMYDALLSGKQYRDSWTSEHDKEDRLYKEFPYPISEACPVYRRCTEGGNFDLLNEKPCRVLAQQFYAFKQTRKNGVYYPDKEVVKKNIVALRLPCVDAKLCSPDQLATDFINNAQTTWTPYVDRRNIFGE